MGSVYFVSVIHTLLASVIIYFSESTHYIVICVGVSV